MLIDFEAVSDEQVVYELLPEGLTLLKVVDYDNEQKVGWFKWRNSDGTLNMQPDFLN